MYINLIPISALLLLAAFLFYSLALKRITSFSFTLVGLIVLEIIHLLIRHWVTVMAHSEEYAVQAFFLWYSLFSITDFLFIFAIYTSTKRLGLHLDHATKTVCGLMGVLGFLQLLRMLDRLLFDSDLAMTLYTKGVPALNLALSLIVLIVVILSFFNVNKNNH